MDKLSVLNRDVSYYKYSDEDYICLTDIAKYKNPGHADDLIRNWLRNRNTIEFLGLWEQLNNNNFNPVEFDGIKKEAGLNSFALTPRQWIEKINAIGIISKAGRYGGTYAHKDIAFEFAAWISVESNQLSITRTDSSKFNLSVTNGSVVTNLSCGSKIAMGPIGTLGHVGIEFSDCTGGNSSNWYLTFLGSEKQNINSGAFFCIGATGDKLELSVNTAALTKSNIKCSLKGTPVTISQWSGI